jgi:hypothetical protein
MNKTGLQEFKEVLKNFRELGSFAIKGTVALPLLNLWYKLGPPPATTIALLTSAMEFLAVMWTFHFWHGMPRKRLNIRMRLSAIVFCIALAASGILIERFTLRRTPARDGIVLGWVLRPDVRPLMSATYTPMDALRDAEYDPRRVWTLGSISLVHAVVIACWLITFVSVSVFTSIFIIQQKRQQLSSQPATRGGTARPSKARVRRVRPG